MGMWVIRPRLQKLHMQRFFLIAIILKERLQIIILTCRLEDGQLRTLCESGVGYVAKSGAASASPTTRLTRNRFIKTTKGVTTHQWAP